MPFQFSPRPIKPLAPFDGSRSQEDADAQMSQVPTQRDADAQSDDNDDLLFGFPSGGSSSSPSGGSSSSEDSESLNPTERKEPVSKSFMPASKPKSAPPSPVKINKGQSFLSKSAPAHYSFMQPMKHEFLQSFDIEDLDSVVRFVNRVATLLKTSSEGKDVNILAQQDALQLLLSDEMRLHHAKEILNRLRNVHVKLDGLVDQSPIEPFFKEEDDNLMEVCSR